MTRAEVFLYGAAAANVVLSFMSGFSWRKAIRRNRELHEGIEKVCQLRARWEEKIAHLGGME